MIITDKLIYIHFPKSGGTFISKILNELYQDNLNPRFEKSSFFKKLIRPKPFLIDYRAHISDKEVLSKRQNHNGCSMIPEKYDQLPVFTTLRNPYDFYMSYFETKKWINEWTVENTAIKQRFADFPNLEFEVFLSFLDFYYIETLLKDITGISIDKKIGLYTLLFILLYSTDPTKVLDELSKMDDLKNVSEETLMIHPNIVFLDFINLNDQLFGYLSRFYEKKDIEFLYHSKKENVAKDDKPRNRKDYYTEKVLDRINELDVIGLSLFKKNMNEEK